MLFLGFFKESWSGFAKFGLYVKKIEEQTWKCMNAWWVFGILEVFVYAFLSFFQCILYFIFSNVHYLILSCKESIKECIVKTTHGKKN